MTREEAEVSANDMLTPMEVSEILKVKPRTVRVYCQEGKLISTRKGEGDKSHYLIRRGDVERYLSRHHDHHIDADLEHVAKMTRRMRQSPN